ncbi:MAG: hypothetical protein P4M11_06850 [Candidatus Pacebacteria bacterium]|nr:hypothetical protein [Candidatus Paceibacterota bacterium]
MVLLHALAFADKYAESPDEAWTKELRQCMRKTVKSTMKLVHSIGSAIFPQVVPVLEKDSCFYCVLSKCTPPKS